jgi:hypothetical protein
MTECVILLVLQIVGNEVANIDSNCKVYDSCDAQNRKALHKPGRVIQTFCNVFVKVEYFIIKSPSLTITLSVSFLKFSLSVK